MFEDGETVTAGCLAALVSALSRLGRGADGGGADDGDVDAAARIDQLDALERVKAAVAAAQVRVTAAFVDSQEEVAEQWRARARECSDAGDFEGWRAARDEARRASLDDGGTPDGASGSADGSGDRGGSGGCGAADSRPRRRRRPSAMTGVAAQVALARRESPVRGAMHVGLALALTRDMPHTLAALEVGELSEWRAQIIVRETANLTGEQRGLVDAEIVGGPPEPIGALGDRELARRVRAVAYRIDAASVLARAAKAAADRRVTMRPAPDTMAYVTALLPVAQAVAAHAALTAAADAARAAGDDRGKGQVMADTFVARLTGQTCSNPALHSASAEGSAGGSAAGPTAGPSAVQLEVQLVMTDRALFAGDDTPAQVAGYGTVPAGWARDLIKNAAGVWLRQLYTHPATGTLVAMDSTRRTFDGGLRRYLLTRDAGTCRTPWCEAPARHIDHVRDHADGGPTSAENGQGLCVRCNHTKQLPGWTARPIAPPGDTTGGVMGRRHTVETTTPTGHRYTSTAPPLLPGHIPVADSPLEHRLALALALALAA